MAAIDSLLRVMVLRDAEALTMATGQVPALRRAGQVEKMAMPPLDAGLITAFVEDVVAAEQRDELEQRGRLEVVYQSGPDRFGVQVERTPTGYKLQVRRQTSPTILKPAAAQAPGSRLQAPAAAEAPGSRLQAPGSGASTGTGTAPGSGANGFVSDPVATAASSVPEPGARSLEPGASVSPRLHALIARAIATDASDILLSTGGPPRLRVAGDIVDTEDDHVTEAEILALITEDASRRALAAAGSTDLAIAVRLDDPDGHGHASHDLGLDDDHASHVGTTTARLRVNVFRHHHGLAAALRPIRTRVPTLRDLGLPDDLAELVRPRNGLVLVTGQAGSGKSTTLVALVEHLNRTRPRHIITLEDPIEFQYAPQRCLIHQREVGRHVASFADGLRAALRESPDVIVVGELRDRETIAIALTAAETGHLVLGTLHAPGAAVAIDRLVDVFPEHQQRQVRLQLASVLRTLVTQFFFSWCGGDRVPALERVPITPALAALIRKNELQMVTTAIQTGRDLGMVPLERSLARLIRAGAIDEVAARAVAGDPDYLTQVLRGA